MRSVSVRFVFGALAGLAVALASVGVAQAQTSQPALGGSPLAAAVVLRADTTEVSAMKAAEDALVSPFRTAARASFAPLQDASRENQGVGIGALIMMTRTSFNVDDLEENVDLDSRSGWGAGLWIGGNRNGRVGFTGEFIYLKRNGNDDEGFPEVTAFQIPAVFHINFGSRSRDSLGGYIVLGPSFTMILKQEIDGETIDDDEKFKGADIGFIAGAGIEFFRVGVEARGNWGLRSISPEGETVDTKTFTFELLGKFAFN